MRNWNRYDETYKSDYEQADYHTRKVFPRIGLIIAGAVLFFVALGLLLGGINWITAPFRGAADQREKTVADGDYRIAAYDEFFNSCEAIAAKERIIARYEEQREASTDESEKVRLGAAILAEKNVRDELIADYNADAAKEGTRGQFRASNLPYTIDPEGVTSCTA